MRYKININDNDIERIRSIPYLQASVYHDLDICATLDFFVGRYVAALNNFFDISNSHVVDCGAGHGWFSFAYLLAGGKATVAVDVDGERLDTAQQIAEILSIDNRIKFIKSPIHTIPLSSNEVDIFVSIETLEHVGRQHLAASLHKMNDIASKGLLITTPNKYFPIIAHDTQLPFAHWIPQRMRRRYASYFNREDMDENNDFLSPFDLNVLLDKFKPSTNCLTFKNYSDFKNQYPFYLPYGSDENRRMKLNPSIFKATYYKIVSTLFGNYSYWVMPNMAHIFIRR